ncbi:hypothetical protein AX14_005215 [Amanita brunnescens Koide BX004]|nr:hypothetical protein AX14_005215 [Amanita brunnescens Koide BX004]
MSPKGGLFLSIPLLLFVSRVYAHVSIWHPSMFGFNVTSHTFPYDNRPVAPLMDMTFDQWWFHGHLDYPPNPGDIMDLPAGQSATFQIACDKGYTSYYASSSGGDVRSKTQPNYPCPGNPTSQFHALNEDDVTGCALSIAYNPNAKSVKPEDLVVFSVNYQCVWTMFTDFEVPADMPACPDGGCTCAFHWIHSPKSGSAQMYMNGFKCKITNAKPDAPKLAKPQLARRCGYDKYNDVPGHPANCTDGPINPMYWKQRAGNNMLEGPHSPPLYNALYGLKNGAQNNIFVSPISRRSLADQDETASNAASSVKSPAKKFRHVRIGSHSVGL